MSKDEPSTQPLRLQQARAVGVTRNTLTVMGLAALVFDNERKIEYAILANSRVDLKLITDRLKTKTEKVNENKIYRCALMRAGNVDISPSFNGWADADPQAPQPAPAVKVKVADEIDRFPDDDDDDDLL